MTGQEQQSFSVFKEIESNISGMLYKFVLKNNTDYSMPYCSPACFTIYEIDSETAKKDVSLLMNMTHPEDKSALIDAIIRSATLLENFHKEVRIIAPSGKLKWLRLISTPKKESKNEISWHGIALDITTEKETELKLKEHELLIHSINTNLPIVIYIYDIPSEKNIFINSKFFEIVGYSEKEYHRSGADFFESFFHPADLSKFDNIKKKYSSATDQDWFIHEFRVKHKDGKYRWLLGRESVFKRAPDGTPLQLLGSCIDITDKIRNEKKLQKMEAISKSLEQKEQLVRSISLIKGQEDERARVSRELHDGLGQILTATKMSIDDVIDSPKLPKNIQSKLLNVKDLIKETIVESRRLSNDLTPSSLNDLGLVSAIRHLIKQSLVNTNANISLNCSSKFRRINNTIEIALFRIIQEALNNALKYASAKNIFIHLKLHKSIIYLEITDDGKGFNLSSPSKTKRVGRGIYNMRERARLINAKLEIISTPEKGCRILIESPKQFNELRLSRQI